MAKLDWKRAADWTFDQASTDPNRWDATLFSACDRSEMLGPRLDVQTHLTGLRDTDQARRLAEYLHADVVKLEVKARQWIADDNALAEAAKARDEVSHG